MKEQLNKLKQEFSKAVKDISSLADLEDLENKFLSRKNGLLTEVLKGLKEVPKDQIAEMGKLSNEVKTAIAQELEILKNKYKKSGSADADFDMTLPGTKNELGHLHISTTAIREILKIFEEIGFQRVRHPEVEWDYYTFEALNMPADHPARDEWETFFIDTKNIDKKYGKRILTPHSTSGDVREMEKGKLPIRMLNITKCYRRQIDVSHAPMFHQFDGLLIDENINIGHLKGTLDYFAKKFFGADRTTRIRPHHFQFTEPSFEVDISCGLCGGKGCKMCKEGWVELGGSGMIHPNVLRAGGIDPKKYSGFAFGWGVERTYMMKSGLNVGDIRLLYKNDLRVLKQF